MDNVQEHKTFIKMNNPISLSNTTHYHGDGKISPFLFTTNRTGWGNYATSRKVAGSIIDDLIGFSWDRLSL
jgi:hypothetical protein